MSALGLGLVLGAYLLGSVPSGYIVTKALKGIDIRRLGSGHLGGSNVWAFLSFEAFLLVGLADAAKGVTAVGVPRLLGLDLWLVVAAGWAAILGQTWSAFLGGAGGRGIATIAASLFLLAPREAVAFSLFLLIGRRIPHSAVVLLLVLGSLPLLAGGLGEPVPVIAYILGAFLLHFSKRMLGNRMPWHIPAAERGQVLRYRFLFDRDTREHMGQVYYEPEPAEGSR